VSYGRSSLIVTMMCIGLLLRIHHELVTESRPANRRMSNGQAGDRP
jgi:cell division protein FtsW (lipid II flippase)